MGSLLPHNVGMLGCPPEAQMWVCEGTASTRSLLHTGPPRSPARLCPDLPACPRSSGDGVVKGLIESPPAPLHLHLLSKQHELMKRCKHSDLCWQECLLK